MEGASQDYGGEVDWQDKESEGMYKLEWASTCFRDCLRPFYVECFQLF